MTRKHFRSLAFALNRAKPGYTPVHCPVCDALVLTTTGNCEHCGSPDVYNVPSYRENYDSLDGWMAAAIAVSTACREHNSSFDRQRFLHACITGED